MKKIAHFGAFDHSSFGDLLFPRIAEHFLPDCQLIHVAPTGIPAGWHDAQPIIGVHEALGRTDWTGILIGGGDIIQAGAWSSEKWKRHFDTPFCSLPSIWAGACLLSAKLEIPLAWNSPGVPAPFPANYAEIARLALEASDYLAVRDERSANHLLQHTDRSISIVPDSAILMHQVWQARPEGREDLAVSIGWSDINASAGDIRRALAYYRKSRGKHAKTVAVQLMPWEFEFEDYEGVLRSNDIDADVAPPFSIEAIVDAIASSAGYIGNSLHGLIAAIAYGVPAVLVPPAGKSSHKYEGFLRAAGLNVSAHLATSWTMAVELLAAQGRPSVSRAAVERIEAHWNAIRVTLAASPVGKKKVWSRLSRLVREQGERLGLLGMSPDCFRDNARSAVDQLNRAPSERDSYIKSLHEEIITRNTHIERLTTAVAERDGQIASLSQAVTERDGQIASLSQAVTERDGQIASLSQAVTERDGQIVSLTDETVSRGEWALRLDAELQDLRAKLLAVTRSNSWRLTLPLREARRWLSSPEQQAKRYTKVTLKLAKRVYQSLPLSYQTKARHRQLIAKSFPRLLLAAGTPAATIPAFAVRQVLPEHDLVGDSALASIDAATRIASFVIPTSDCPEISIIIPVYGKIDYTLHCLRSIASNSPQTAFEVIVVDDCSPDDSFDVLSRVQGIRLLRNEHNQGFILSCNNGATSARGHYLHFLNNDTEVTHGWLDELLRTFREFPGTGLVGSKLVYPDGRLQEAGGIIWQDGSAWNFGRFEDPQLPIFNYAREVDYCSGASIMVPKALFDELDGFDEYYLPAYCEDSDLALKIRDKGYRVIYQPLSTVIHFEGITSGTDTTQGAKAYQVENSRKLFERWQDCLQTHQAPGMNVDKAKDRRVSLRVLVLDHCTPTPDQDAGSITVFNLLLLLREMDFQATFIPEDNFLYMPEYTTALQRAGIEVLYAPYVTNVEQHLKECGARYDLTFLFRPGVVERHLKIVRKYSPKAKVLFHTVDLHFLRMSREAELQSDNAKQKAADEMKQRELAAIRAADATIVHSTAELEILCPLLPEAKLHVFPLIMDVKMSSNNFAERRDIVFVGGYQHTPNVDAVQYFVTEIMPLLRKQLPKVRFYAVGSKPPAAIQELAAEDVIVTGFVKNLTPLLDRMRVSVAPLRYGAGIKGKIGTAMAVGLPVIATSLAAEGMSLTDGENILVADGAEALAGAIARIYQDEALWNRISENGVAFAEQTWGAEAAWKILAGILCELGFSSLRGNRRLILYETDRGDVKKVATTNFTQPTLGACVADDEYRKKVQQELAIYEKQVNVHDLPDIYHYWSNKYLAPIFRDAGFSTIAEFFSSNLLVAAARTCCTKAYFVSVGAGNCDLEVSIAKNLLQAGLSEFILECLEINPVMLERGRQIAKENGVLDKMIFVEADFNTWRASREYHGVMANQSLHHVTQLENLFDQVRNALHRDGSFVISDMIGRNGHQRWPEALDMVQRYWKELPDTKKYNHLLNRFEAEYDNWDCSKEGFEGIRAEDILPLLVQRFECEKFIGFGNVIDIFVDRCFGHNYSRESEEDKALIDKVHAEDEAGFASGTLTPTHMMAIFCKTLHCEPFYSRGIKPHTVLKFRESA